MDRLPKKYDALTNYDVIEKWNMYSTGYEKAGFYLIDKLIQDMDKESNKEDWDELIYPICFDFRHYIELRLKNIIIEKYGTIVGNQKCKDCSHFINKLWEIVKPIFSEKNKETWKPEEVDRLEKLILDFANFDDYSDAFRYPVDLRNNISLKLNFINYKTLKKEIKYISESLDALYWTFYREIV